MRVVHLGDSAVDGVAYTPLTVGPIASAVVQGLEFWTQNTLKAWALSDSSALPRWLNALATLSKSFSVDLIYEVLADTYPNCTIATYTSTHDVTQVNSLSLKLNSVQAELQRNHSASLAAISAVFSDPRNYVNVSRAFCYAARDRRTTLLSKPNYREFVFAGNSHGILNLPAFYNVTSTKNTDQSSIAFKDWLRDLLTDPSTASNAGASASCNAFYPPPVTRPFGR
jgi:hypothetical protein